MYVNRNISAKIIWQFAWKNLLFLAVYGTAVYFLIHYFEHKGHDVSIPFVPLSTIGIAVAFYVGFKNNQSYDRFWEARKIWGGIVNYSRTWANQVLSFVDMRYAKEGVTEEEMRSVQKELIYRQMAWMNALRLQLRQQTHHSIDHSKIKNSNVYQGRPQEEHWKEEVGKFILSNEEVQTCIAAKNKATQLIRIQGERLKDICTNGLIEEFRQMEMMGSLEEFYNLQGKCERINGTPLPRQYSFFSTLFVRIFILLLPFGLAGEFSSMGHDLSWLSIPFFILIAWIFYTMDVVGETSEDPFENFINDVPMTAMCRTIEIDLRQMLGETDIPPGLKPVDGVLM